MQVHFVIAIECCIDIANHIIASENFASPKTMGCFAVLIDEGIVPETSANRSGHGRFRKQAVHIIGSGDRRVYEYLKPPWGFSRFARAGGGASVDMKVGVL